MVPSFASSWHPSNSRLHSSGKALGCPTSKLRQYARPRCPHTSPLMIQRPDAEGPPRLEEFLSPTRRKSGAQNEKIFVGTGRSVVGSFENDTAAAVLSAIERAKASLNGEPQVCHCTLPPKINVSEAVNAISASLGISIPVFGRTINREDSDEKIEILLLRTENPGGIPVAAVSIEVEEGTGADPVSAGCQKASKEAACRALEKLDSVSQCTFLLFVCSPGARESVAREGLDHALPGVIAYGGPAVGSIEAPNEWAVISSFSENGFVQKGDVNTQTAVVAAVPGELSFLFSAVVKNWAQPSYTAPLSFMIPNYIDDPEADLLTAIRYDDWEKFLYCIETKGVSINHKWTTKQNQIPLLAACARVRTRMIKYLLDNGADVHYRNGGGFTAAMYTRMLTEYDRDVIYAQLDILEKAGARILLTDEEATKLKAATNGRMVQ